MRRRVMGMILSPVAETFSRGIGMSQGGSLDLPKALDSSKRSYQEIRREDQHIIYDEEMGTGRVRTPRASGFG